MTGGDTAWLYIQAKYTHAGETAYDTVPCLVIDDITPDTLLAAYVMPGWDNDTCGGPASLMAERNEQNCDASPLLGCESWTQSVPPRCGAGSGDSGRSPGVKQ